MIHLMGVDHARAQRKQRGLALTELQLHYRSLVESAIQSLRPDLLAEEDHPSYLAGDGAESILLPIAESHAIPHIFVEADRATQLSLGYKDLSMIRDLLAARDTPSETLANAHKFAHQFPIREQFWLKQLGKTAAGSILLIFGDLHFNTFTALLNARQILFSIFAERVGIDSANDLEYEGLRYALDHNMFGDTDCFCLGK
jgi:hypothetical protein